MPYRCRCGRLLITAIVLAGASLGATTSGADLSAGVSPRPAVWTMTDASDALLPIGDVTLAGIDLDVAAADVQEGEIIVMPVPGRSFEGTVARRRTTNPERFTISGLLDGAHAGGSFVVAVNRGHMAAVIRSGNDGAWQTRVAEDGRFVVERVEDDFACITDAVAPPIAPLDPAALGGPCGDGTVVDVLVIMTSGAVNAAGGLDGAAAVIDLSIEDGNTALTNSNVNAQFNLVYGQRVVVQDALASLGALTNPFDGMLDEVHTLRDAYGADEVVLIATGGGGVANGLSAIDPNMDRFAFCRAGINSTGAFVVAHELGHNLGACHAVGDGGGCGVGLLFDYSNGHRFNGDSGSLWRTVMAYSPGARIPQYSSPTVLWDGQPTGLPIQEEPGADNVRTFAVSTFLVSNFRCNDTICESLDLPLDAEDCDLSGIPDACEIALGWSLDDNENGVPDQCDCTGDIDENGIVGFDDLLRIFAVWLSSCSGCPEDADLNGIVSHGDVQRVIGDWGVCVIQ